MIRVQKALERVETFNKPFWRRRHKRRITRSRAANPVLRASKLAGLFAAAPTGAEKYPVNLPYQTQ